MRIDEGIAADLVLSDVFLVSFERGIGRVCRLS